MRAPQDLVPTHVFTTCAGTRFDFVVRDGVPVFSRINGQDWYPFFDQDGADCLYMRWAKPVEFAQLGLLPE